jgi:PAS domain S-box-containing protein
MNAAQTLSLPVARPLPAAQPAPSLPAPGMAPAPPQASSTAPVSAPGSHAGVAPPASHLAERTAAERSRRWEARVASASMVVVAACALVGLAPHAATLAGSEPGSYLLAAGAAFLAATALEGWRRARGSATDAAALRSALRAARESERWYRSVVDDVVDAVMVASPEGRLVEVNRAATILLGHDREWLMGRRLWDLVPLDDRLVALRRGDTVATQGGGLRRLLRSDGSEVLADVSWHTHGDGRVVYLARRFSRW